MPLRGQPIFEVDPVKMDDPHWIFFRKEFGYQFDQTFPGLEPVGEFSPSPDNSLDMAWIIPVASLKDKVSWATLGMAGLLHADPSGTSVDMFTTCSNLPKTPCLSMRLQE